MQYYFSTVILTVLLALSMQSFSSPLPTFTTYTFHMYNSQI